jgi:hypothetical protein
MTVHSPPSTSLGTRRSDDDMGTDLLEVIESLRNVMTVHSPPSTSLGTRRSACFCGVMLSPALFREYFINASLEHSGGPEGGLCDLNSEHCIEPIMGRCKHMGDCTYSKFGRRTLCGVN